MNHNTNGHPVIVTLDGEWDLARTEELQQLLEPTGNQTSVIVDMSNATYIDSTCIGRLIAMRKQRVANDLPPAAIVVASRQVQRLFQLVGLDRVLAIYNTLEEAMNMHSHKGTV